MVFMKNGIALMEKRLHRSDRLRARAPYVMAQIHAQSPSTSGALTKGHEILSQSEADD